MSNGANKMDNQKRSDNFAPKELDKQQFKMCQKI